MPYIVDGNNVMGQTPGWHRDKVGARRKLIRRLAGFARSKGAHIVVVFDGAPDSAFPENSSFNGVRVLYAEKGSDADSRIEGLVEASKETRGLIVVTSDRQLATTVRYQGARVIRSGEFRKLMDQTPDTNASSTDKDEVHTDQVDAWLRYFGSLPTDDE